jgi:hypothetical protein
VSRFVLQMFSWDRGSGPSWRASREFEGGHPSLALMVVRSSPYHLWLRAWHQIKKSNLDRSMCQPMPLPMPKPARRPQDRQHPDWRAGQAANSKVALKRVFSGTGALSRGLPNCPTKPAKLQSRCLLGGRESNRGASHATTGGYPLRNSGASVRWFSVRGRRDIARKPALHRCEEFHAHSTGRVPGTGPWCGPGYTRQCGPFRCWCRPCW